MCLFLLYITLQFSLTFDLQYGIPFYLQYLAHWPEYFIVAEAPGGELMGYSKSASAQSPTDIFETFNLPLCVSLLYIFSLRVRVSKNFKKCLISLPYCFSATCIIKHIIVKTLPQTLI